MLQWVIFVNQALAFSLFLIGLLACYCNTVHLVSVVAKQVEWAICYMREVGRFKNIHEDNGLCEL